MITVLNDSSGGIFLYPAHFSSLNPLESIENLDLKQETIRLFGKEVLQPRLSALYGKPGTAYKYSGKMFHAIPWTGWLKAMSLECSGICKTAFNTALLNYYRNGMDSMGVHADDERELGQNPVIASVSFGVTRKMIFRNKETKEKLVVPLENGDLLVMNGALQHNWKHELPKEKRVEEARLNITFREIRFF